MELKRTSFVCFGAQGHKDSLVYQEIPGRDGGEEFFLFFSPGDPAQEPLLRSLFREAVSASRLGAPEHYFSQFIDQFKAHGGDADALAGALVMIQIRRGDEVHLLFNRDASLAHWTGGGSWRGAAESLRGFAEIPLGDARDQRDLFRRSAEDLFAVGRFTLVDGEHTLVLAPSEEFLEQHAESLRNSVFFPSFEFPREMGIELAVPRSFPALHWSARPEPAASVEKPRLKRLRALPAGPLVAGVLVGAAALVILFGPLGRHHGRPGAPEERPLLAAGDRAGGDTSSAGSRDPGPAERAARPERTGAGLSLAEAWKRDFTAPVTSSPQWHEGRIFVGCRDGFLYAFGPDGTVAWKYRSGAGIGASPCCAGGRVVAANYRGDVFSLDEKTGKTAWSFATRSKIVSTPAAGANILVVGTTDGRLLAVRLSDARKLWEKKLGASIRANVAVGSDFVLAVTTDGTLFKLDYQGRVLWKLAPRRGVTSSPACREDRSLVVVGTGTGDICGCSLSTGKEIWRFAAGSVVDGSPLVGRDELFIGTKGGDLIALAFDGTPLWRAAVGGAVHSRPVVAGGAVLVTTYASRLVAVEADSGKILGEYLASSAIYSSPEFDGSRVYFGSNGGSFHAVWLKVPAAS
jgi:outer membrane protein assembly factor BamB